MKRCPRCEKEVEEHLNYCPNCGLDLTNVKKEKKPNRLLSIILIIFLLATPFLYSTLFDSLTNGITSNNNELGEYKDESITMITHQFDNLIDFNSTYTNVSSYVQGINAYEDTLKMYDFEKDYNIIVLNNNNIIYQLTYSTKINDFYDLIIVREFDRIHSYNNQTITLKKNNQTEFKDLLLNDEELMMINSFINNKEDVKSIVDEFSLRENEFNDIKETIGHYGMGSYKDDLSFVVERYDLTYTSSLKVKEEVKDYIC